MASPLQSFRLKKFLFLLAALVLIIFLLHLYRTKVHYPFAGHRKDILKEKFLLAPNNDYSSRANRISKIDIKIDKERIALRKVERFNLMEEYYGENWEKTHFSQPDSSYNCNIGMCNSF